MVGSGHSRKWGGVKATMLYGDNNDGGGGGGGGGELAY